MVIVDFIRESEGLSLAEGHRASGRQPRDCTQGRSSSSRTAASCVRRAGSPRPRPADGGGALLHRSLRHLHKRRIRREQLVCRLAYRRIANAIKHHEGRN